MNNLGRLDDVDRQIEQNAQEAYNQAKQQSNQSYNQAQNQYSQGQQQMDQAKAQADSEAAYAKSLQDLNGAQGATTLFEQNQAKNLSQAGYSQTNMINANANAAAITGGMERANQALAQGGARGYNALGAAQNQEGIQDTYNNTISSLNQQQKSMLNSYNAGTNASGTEISAQMNQQANAVSAAHNATQSYQANAQQLFNNYATAIQASISQQGLMGSQVANLLQAEVSHESAKAAVTQQTLNLASAENQRAQAYEATTAGHLNEANTSLVNEQVSYNKQMNVQRVEAQKLANNNNKSIQTQQAKLVQQINNDKSIMKSTASGNNWFVNMAQGNLFGQNHNSDQARYSSAQSDMASAQAQLDALSRLGSPNIAG